VAGGEDEAQEVVAQGVVEGRVEVRRGPLQRFKLAGELLVLAFEHALPAQEV
jgi:hypothetical protein